MSAETIQVLCNDGLELLHSHTVVLLAMLIVVSNLYKICAPLTKKNESCQTGSRTQVHSISVRAFSVSAELPSHIVSSLLREPL